MSKISPIIGHEAAQSQLVELIAQAKLPHAILLSGPQGIGKAALAETLARCLLTGAASATEEAGLFGEALPQTTAISLSYDADHPAIARIEAGGHGNLKWVQPLRDEKKKMSFTTINIDQIRDVIEFMRLSTSEKGWRVVLIDPADGMNRNAENALLKVLEEPPEQTLLVLITHQPDRLLPTTRSRCREIKLHPPTQAQILQILEAKGTNVTDAQQNWLSVLAPASAGQWQRYVEYEADKLYGEWLQILAKPETGAIQTLATKLAKLEPEAWQLACDLLLCALNRLCLSAVEPKELLPEEAEIFPALTQRAPLEHWQNLWAQAVEWLPLTSSGNYDKKQVLQSLLFQAANAPKKAA